MVSVAIVGIGIHPFGRRDGVSGMEQGVFAVRRALANAGVDWQQVQFAFGGSEDAGNADTMVAELGLTGLPFVNVSNGCATGGSAIIAASQVIESEAAELGVVVGFDEHPRGAFNPKPRDWGMGDWYGEVGLMVTTQFFAMKIQRYLHDHDLSPTILTKVAAKAYRNGALNPNAWRRKPLSEGEIEASRMLNFPLRQYMFCSPGQGAVALVLARANRAHRYTDRPVFVRSAALRTRRFGSFEVFSPWLAPDQAPSPTVDAAQAAFEHGGIGPDEIDVAQVQDTESGAEILHMAETGLCADGEQEKLVVTGATELSGQLPVNTDGGCIANGEPIGASGLRQVFETALQLRGGAGERQIHGDPRTGFTHVYGAPGVSACTVLSI